MNIQLDLTATALSVAGVEAKNLDGVNLLPFLSGDRKDIPHPTLYWRFGKQMAIRDGEYKLVRYDSNVDTRTGVRNQPVSETKLYNLAKDTGETNDLASAMPEKVKDLEAKWNKWNATLMDPRWGGKHTR